MPTTTHVTALPCSVWQFAHTLASVKQYKNFVSHIASRIPGGPTRQRKFYILYLVSEMRMSELTTLLFHFRGRTSCTKQELLSLVGALRFVTKCMPASRTLLRRMVDLSKTAKKLFHHISLSVEFHRKNIKWWKSFPPL